MSLDTLSQVMKIECCWIQTIEEARRPSLAAERGLTPEMRAELAAMDMEHGLTREIIGLGHRIIIPDLATDGAYGLESFRQARFRWLIAVPLMTYRVHGILGIASRSKKTLHKETPELAMVIGGLIGAALNRSGLSPRPAKEKKPGAVRPVPKSGPAPAPDAARREKPFEAHRQRMQKFRGAHGPGQHKGPES